MKFCNYTLCLYNDSIYHGFCHLSLNGIYKIHKPSALGPHFFALVPFYSALGPHSFALVPFHSALGPWPFALTTYYSLLTTKKSTPPISRKCAISDKAIIYLRSCRGVNKMLRGSIFSRDRRSYAPRTRSSQRKKLPCKSRGV